MRIVYSRNALRQLKRLDTIVKRGIKGYMARLAALDDPRSRGRVLKENADLWRYRVGDWRIIARICDDALQIALVHEIHTSDIYNE